MRRSTWLALAVLAVLFASLAMRAELLRLPEVRPAASGGFDTHAALARLGRILGDQRPHPADTAANDAVRARLVAELRAIGLEPRVTDNIVCDGSKRSRTAACARVRNVVATVGPAEGKHLLLVSHYDSTPAGPGASDDGIGMAAMLETAAQLRGKELKRPVTFLFNEGEEVALLGARAFLDHDPVAPRVGTLLNFESRGVSGPALMFETSRPNGLAARYLQRAVTNPTANSMATDFYRLIPNSTDVAVFERRPWTILNFAVIGNETRYHSAGDRIEALDPRSLQHMGDQALELTLDIAGRDAPVASGNAAFADVLGRYLVVLPANAALAGLVILLLLAAVTAWRRKPGRAVATVAAAMTSGAALCFVAQAAVKLVRHGDYWRAWPIVTDMALYASVLLACVVSLVWIGRKAEAGSLRRGFWLVFLALGTAASFALPGASILFLLPAIPAVVGLLAGRRFKGAEPGGAVAGALLIYLLWAPLLWLLGLLLEQGSVWLFAPVAAAIVLPWLIEAKALFDRAAPKPLIALWGVLALGLWGAVALIPAYSLDRKQEFGIEYLWDASRERARWLVVNDGAPVPDVPGKTFGERIKVPWSTRARWTGPAPANLASAPSVEIIGQKRVAKGRIVAIRLRPSGSEWITLRGPSAARLLAVQASGSYHRIGGKKPSDDKDKPGADEDSSSNAYTFRCEGRSCDGLTVHLLLGSTAPVEWSVIGFNGGLPAAAAPIVAARPATAQPQYTPDTTIGLSRIRF